MSLRIAIAGKGGTGKSTVASLLCRGLLRQGVKPLLAVDADPNSCLPDKLGLDVDQTIGNLREQIRDDPEQVPAGVSKTEWIERLIHEDIAEARGLDMVVMGRQEGPSCYCYINNVLRQCLDRISRQYQGVVIDNEAGLEHLSRRTNGQVEVLLVVCQPTVTGARTASRIVALSKELKLEIGATYLVLNQCDGPLPEALAAEFDRSGLETVCAVPFDPTVADCELNATPLLGLGDESPAAKAVDQLCEVLWTRRKS